MNNKKIKFGDLETTNNNPCSFEDKFFVESDSDNVVAISNKTFKHDCDDCIDFEYKYVIDMFKNYTFNSAGKEVVCVQVSLCLIPTKESICDKVLSEIVSNCNVTDPSKLSYLDLVSFGGVGATFGVETFEISEECDVLSHDKTKEILFNISNVFEIMDRFRGFYLDKCWNHIGSTGWDTILYAVMGEE